MPSARDSNQHCQPSLDSWMKSESGKRAITGALERSRKETTRLKQVRAIDPKKYEEVITI